jgi:hypothetical protein
VEVRSSEGLGRIRVRLATPARAEILWTGQQVALPRAAKRWEACSIREGAGGVVHKGSKSLDHGPTISVTVFRPEVE